VAELHKLSQSELTFAYDSLIEYLQSREEMIKRRIEESLLHLGPEERILFE
jgi:hypothetical protein